MTNVCVHVCVRVCVLACVCVRLYICAYLYARMRVRSYVNACNPHNPLRVVFTILPIEQRKIKEQTWRLGTWNNFYMRYMVDTEFEGCN